MHCTTCWMVDESKMQNKISVTTNTENSYLLTTIKRLAIHPSTNYNYCSQGWTLTGAHDDRPTDGCCCCSSLWTRQPVSMLCPCHICMQRTRTGAVWLFGWSLDGNTDALLVADTVRYCSCYCSWRCQPQFTASGHHRITEMDGVTDKRTHARNTQTIFYPRRSQHAYGDRSVMSSNGDVVHLYYDDRFQFTDDRPQRHEPDRLWDTVAE